jgi:hypothetical protein
VEPSAIEELAAVVEAITIPSSSIDSQVTMDGPLSADKAAPEDLSASIDGQANMDVPPTLDTAIPVKALPPEPTPQAIVAQDVAKAPSDSFPLWRERQQPQNLLQA